MTATEWRRLGLAKSAVVDLTLPSGMVIKARRPDPVQIATWGVLPMGLASSVGGAQPPKASVEETLATMALMRDILVYCCVQPRISLNPQGEDEIHPRDISMADSMFINRWAMREAETEQLRTFRGGADAGGVGDNGQDVRRQAERIDGVN